MVLLPKVAVILVQAKFYLQTTGFSQSEVYEELWKMGYESTDAMRKLKVLHGVLALSAEPKVVPDVFHSLDRGALETHLMQEKCNCSLCTKFSESGCKERSTLRCFFVCFFLLLLFICFFL